MIIKFCTSKNWKWKLRELKRRLTYELPSPVEDAMEFEVEERRVGVPATGRSHGFFYADFGVKIFYKPMRSTCTAFSKGESLELEASLPIWASSEA